VGKDLESRFAIPATPITTSTSTSTITYNNSLDNTLFDMNMFPLSSL
jgi:hypothetical protein